MFLHNFLEKKLNVQIVSTSLMGGGDISRVYRLTTDKNDLVCKMRRGTEALTMFRAEMDGLRIIGESQTVAVPEIIACDIEDDVAYLVMEYINNKTPDAKNMQELGYRVALMHQKPGAEFGLPADNFIGSLKQSNTPAESWPEFYATQRLGEQIKLSVKNGLLSKNEIPSKKLTLQVCRDLLPKCQPSLVHGDLWSGNYLIARDGTPYLIDPAVYYGHGEVDIAMSKLFGGFEKGFYDTYFSIHPQSYGFENRVDLYQLYYLLVHLNMFGSSYYGQVKSLLRKYFSAA